MLLLLMLEFELVLLLNQFDVEQHDDCCYDDCFHFEKQKQPEVFCFLVRQKDKQCHHHVDVEALVAPLAM